MIRIYSK